MTNKNGLKEEFLDASQCGYIRRVRLCLDQGIDINARTYGHTALGRAIHSGHTAVIRELIARGASPEDVVLFDKENIRKSALECAEDTKNSYIHTFVRLCLSGTFWTKEGDRQVVRTSLTGDDSIMIETFDFSRSFYTNILRHSKDNASHTCSGFHTLPPAMIQEASGELKKLGGMPGPERPSSARLIASAGPA